MLITHTEYDLKAIKMLTNQLFLFASFQSIFNEFLFDKDELPAEQCFSKKWID